MGMLLFSLLSQHWQKAVEFIALFRVICVIGFQNYELKNDKANLLTAAMVHEADQARIAYLSKTLQDQNDAVTALQAAQVQKEQIAEKAFVVAQVKQQKVVTLLAPTNNKKPSTCEEAMPDVRALLRGLQQ
jgi:hypothetical protein